MTRFASLLMALAWFFLPAVSAANGAGGKAASVRRYLGPAVAIGRGRARIVVLASAAHRPLAIGLEFTPAMMEGLPPKPSPDPALDWHYDLEFPKGAPATGFDHVMIDWHPLGHPPPGIYTVAHFDFHFYLISRHAQLHIHPPRPGKSGKARLTLPASVLMPSGYVIPPPAEVVDRMGLHAVPAAGPEFHGHPFTNTLIYGYDTKAELAFLEPMIATAYLHRRQTAM